MTVETLHGSNIQGGGPSGAHSAIAKPMGTQAFWQATSASGR
jgi:hypothetical protein